VASTADRRGSRFRGLVLKLEECTLALDGEGKCAVSTGIEASLTELRVGKVALSH